MRGHVVAQHGRAVPILEHRDDAPPTNRLCDLLNLIGDPSKVLITQSEPVRVQSTSGSSECASKPADSE